MIWSANHGHNQVVETFVICLYGFNVEFVIWSFRSVTNKLIIVVFLVSLQPILDARAIYPACSLADLYDEVTMPPELRKAHQANDKAVMKAYVFWGKLNTETACVAELMKMYQKLTEQG